MMGQLQREETDFCTSSAPTPERHRFLQPIRVYPADPMRLTSLKPSPLPHDTALIRPFSGMLDGAILISFVYLFPPIVPTEFKCKAYSITVQYIRVNHRAHTYAHYPIKHPGEVWVSVAVGVLVWGVILWMLQLASSLLTGQQEVSFITSVLYGWGALLEQPPRVPSVTVSGQVTL